jgi:protein-disulfide isomerase
VTGTPTVFINGTKFTGDLFTTGPLTAAVQQAATGK